MRKLICALIGAAALVASATTYIQTSPTGTAPWRPVKDSVSLAHLADSALHAPPSAYADSSRTSGLADSAKRAGWAPLDTGRVRGIVSDTATALRTYIGSASTTGNAATATKLATVRTISITGDGTWSTSFDGSANATGALTLATLLTAGSVGSATTVPTLTWDAKGRLTAVGSAAISIPHTQINDWSSYVSTAAIGALPYALVSGSVDFNNIASKVAGAYPIFGTASYSNAPPGLTVNAGGGMLWQGFGANNAEWNAQVFVDAQQDALWYRTESHPATWRDWHQLLTSTSSIPHTQISDWSTATSSFLTANQPISLTGAVTGSGTTPIATSFANTHLAGINQDLTTTSSPTFTTVTANLTGNAATATYSDSSRASHISDSAKALAHYGTLAQDTAIAKKVASDTATVLRTGIASAITTSEAYATARISDSLTANTRAWTTLTAAKGSVHDSLTVERAFDSIVSRSVAHDTATVLRTYIGSASTTGNAATATKLATARTIATSGDVTGTPTAFDGTANITIPTALPTLLAAGSAGSATAVPTLTWDAKGRLTAATSTAISIPHTQINDWATSTTPDAIGALSSMFQTGAVDFNSINSNIAGAYAIFGTTSYSHAPSGLGANGGGGMLWQGYGANRIDWNAQVFVDAQQDILWYRTQGSPAAWRGWHQLLTSTSSIPHTQINDWSTATSSFLTANQSISLTGAVTGSGATSIATSFANTHLAGINQDLTTSSSPTFASATIGNGIYRAYAGANPSLGSIYASGVAPGALNYVLAWDQNGTGAYLNGTSGAYLSINNSNVLIATSTGVSIKGTLTASGLITANGGISGNLTGHASLDIPLTGSVAVTGSIQTTQGLYAASGMVGMYSMYDNIFTIGNNAHNIQVNNTTGETNFIGLTSVGMQGSLTVSGTFTPAVNSPSTEYTISSSDQGKMVISINQLNLPLTGISKGFWCLISWHSGGGGAKLGPSTSGTAWYLRGSSTTVGTLLPVSGIASWDGYTWYVN